MPMPVQSPLSLMEALDCFYQTVQLASDTSAKKSLGFVYVPTGESYLEVKHNGMPFETFGRDELKKAVELYCSI